MPLDIFLYRLFLILWVGFPRSEAVVQKCMLYIVDIIFYIHSLLCHHCFRKKNMLDKDNILHESAAAYSQNIYFRYIFLKVFMKSRKRSFSIVTLCFGYPYNKVTGCLFVCLISVCLSVPMDLAKR